MMNLITLFLKYLFFFSGHFYCLNSLTFILLRVLPGGPFDKDKRLPPQIKANIEKKYNFDKPLTINILNI